MEHAKELERNIQNLFEKLAAVNGLAERIAASGKPQMEVWLEDLKRIEGKAGEVQQKLDGLKVGLNPNIKKNRKKLNKKVIKFLNDLDTLEDEGKVKAESTECLLKELQRDIFEQFTPADLEEFTENYLNKISQGAYGRVYKGYLRDRLPVAVKVLNDYETDITSGEETFMAEVRTMGKTSHKNLVKLYGFCFTLEIKALVYEYMEKGSLDKYLYDQSSERIEWAKLYQIAVDTARGLSYLHEGLEDRIIHHDVKPANVVLDSDFCPKLTDFGIAKPMSRDLTHVTWTSPRGTPGFAAPEMWKPESRVTYKCDVYSFGIMLFEIFGRRKNLTDGIWFPKQVSERINNSELNHLLDECHIKEDDREKAKMLCTVALQCIEEDAESRPTMSSVIRMLDPDPSIRVDETPLRYGGVPVTAEEEDQQTTNISNSSRVGTFLEEFRYKCPPGGENLVIIYTTTDPHASVAVLEACDYVRRIFESYGIHMVERDCYIDANYVVELENVLRKPKRLPSVFVSGRYIGGHRDIENIEDLGKMEILLLGVQLVVSSLKVEVFSEDEMCEQVPNSPSRAAELMLEGYKYICPPGGEQLVIIYTTTDPYVSPLVRKNCAYVRSTLVSYGVKIVERDCYIHGKYSLELENVLRKQKRLPRVFVKGRYIGGCRETERIQEQGKMLTLLHGIQLLASTSKLEAFSEDDMGEQIPNSPSRIAQLMLERYKYKCPPKGENSVIIYTTTDLLAKALVRINCDYVRSILESYRVEISERDCYIDTNYKLELENVMRRTKKLPRVFVKGRYIGGHRETGRLHEDGEMSTLLHGIRQLELCE